MKFKATSAILFSSLLSAPSFAASDYKNTIGAGGAFMSGSMKDANQAASMEIEDGGFYLTGTFGEVPQLPINAQFLDSDGGYYRVDAQYMIDDAFSIHIGYSVYEHKANSNDDNPGESFTEKGVYFGAGYTFQNKAGETYTFIQREQIFDGNATVGVRHRAPLSPRTFIELGFRLNSAIPNEATLAMLIRF